MPEVCMLNGRFVPTRAAAVPIDDWAVRYGWGLFETIRIHRHCPLFLERHLERFCGTAPLLELGVDFAGERDRWETEIVRSLNRARLSEGTINCYWTRGSALGRIAPARVVRIRPRPRYPKRPLSLWVAPWRIEPTYPGTGVKTLAYFPYIFAGISARREGFDEALVLNTTNHVADGAASSIFIVRGKKVTTPALDQGTLRGITRSVVLEILTSENIRSSEESVSWRALLKADAIFVGSALRGVVPVANIAGHWKARRVDNPITSRVIKAYSGRIRDYVRCYGR